jgi:Flp pilus assembly pilin Flp
MNMLKKFWRDESGGESAEWPLVVGLVAVGAIAIITALGGEVTRVFGLIETALSDVTPGAAG